MFIYTTIYGDTVDEIVHRFYGETVGFIEEVYRVNRHLADLPEILSEDIKIVLPDISRETEEKELTLWD